MCSVMIMIMIAVIIIINGIVVAIKYEQLNIKRAHKIFNFCKFLSRLCQQISHFCSSKSNL